MGYGTVSADEREDRPLIPLYALAELAYCPRKYYFGQIEGETGQSILIERGRAEHASVDDPALKGRRRREKDKIRTRAVEVASLSLGLTAKLDVLEEDAEGEATPVEHKRGRGKDPPWPEDRVQLGAQMMLLREAGYSVRRGVVFYGASRQRVEVALNTELEREVRAVLSLARDLEHPEAPVPPVLEDRQRCNGCRFIGICLPEEVAYVHSLGEDPPGTPDEGPPVRVIAGKSTGETLYVDLQGAKLSIKGETLEIRKEGELVARQPLNVLDAVVLAGMIGLTSYAISALLTRGIPVSFISVGGRYKGALVSARSRNGLLRLAQARVAADPPSRLSVARSMVAGKIRNQRAMLLRQARRRGIERLERAVTVLEHLAERAYGATQLDQLRGLEGSAARIYFSGFARTLGGAKADAALCKFARRRRRPPPDPVNALLSYLYSILISDITSMLHVVGLDPFIGFLHGQRYAQPALALDLVEELRPVIADSMVLRLVNNGELGKRDFIPSPTGMLLTEGARKRVYALYAERKAGMVQHPVYGYQVTWTRVMEVQARMLAKTLTGELKRYVPFAIR